MCSIWVFFFFWYVGKRGFVMFRCFVFAGCDRSAGLAMAKNSFKLEHPLGLFAFPFFFFFFFFKSSSLLNKVWIFCDNHVFFFNGFCDCCLELWKCVWIDEKGFLDLTVFVCSHSGLIELKRVGYCLDGDY
jgi:hypothetical protein